MVLELEELLLEELLELLELLEELDEELEEDDEEEELEVDFIPMCFIAFFFMFWC